VLAEILPACRHGRRTGDKADAEMPAIEFYPLFSLQDEDGRRVSLDLWEGMAYEDSMIFPERTVVLDSIAGGPMALQIPNKAKSVLGCLYGDWRVPSDFRGRKQSVCLEDDGEGEGWKALDGGEYWKRKSRKKTTSLGTSHGKYRFIEGPFGAP